MTIHETAFLTCAYRSYDPELSGDLYAFLFNNPQTDFWAHAISSEVSDQEPFLHCLRNRYFLDKIISFFEKNPNGVLVNWGAGFSMYPFLIPQDVYSIDIDQKDIVDYKSAILQKWVVEGKIPNRKLDYINADFRAENLSDLILNVKTKIDSRPCFFILEGVLYFLSKGVTDKLFTAMKKIQNQGDLLGCVSFLPEAGETPVMQKLNSFFDKNNFTDDSFSHQLLSTESYSSREGYSLVDHQDYCTLSLKYKPSQAISDKYSILNENMYILERK